MDRLPLFLCVGQLVRTRTKKSGLNDDSNYDARTKIRTHNNGSSVAAHEELTRAEIPATALDHVYHHVLFQAVLQTVRGIRREYRVNPKSLHSMVCFR